MIESNFKAVHHIFYRQTSNVSRDEKGLPFDSLVSRKLVFNYTVYQSYGTYDKKIFQSLKVTEDEIGRGLNNQNPSINSLTVIRTLNFSIL